MPPGGSREGLVFACPACRHPFESLDTDRWRCASDGIELHLVRGIWRIVGEAADPRRARFLDGYRRIRAAEGWGSDDPEYYRSLPFRDTSGRHSEIWRIRAASFRMLESQVLGDRSALRLADLGAGSCWLAARLAGAGHEVVAIDFSDDPCDGLGAADSFAPPHSFERIEADFDAIPLAGGRLDAAIFNGSFHYTTDAATTLREARRLLRPAGVVVIMDTPVYRLAVSGTRALQERSRDGSGRHPIAKEDHAMEAFLTRRRLHRIGRESGFEWTLHHLPLGLRWHLRPWLNLLCGRREPARFPLIVGRLVPPARHARGER